MISRRLIILALVLGGATLILFYLLTSGISAPPLSDTELRKPDTTEAEIQAFLESYFSTWSRGDIEGYRSHFHEEATIVYLDAGAPQFVLKRDEFVDMQANIIAQSPTQMTESVVSSVINTDGVGAVATVNWVLDDGNQTVRGVDRFVLIQSEDGEWIAISLLFYITGTENES